jgi:hypothetical protein
MSEISQAADRLIIIGRGKVLADTSTIQLIEADANRSVLLGSPRMAELTRFLTANGASAAQQDNGAIVVTEMEAPAIGDLAAEHGIPLHALVPRQPSLEEAYLNAMGDNADYGGEMPPGRDRPPDDCHGRPAHRARPGDAVAGGPRMIAFPVGLDKVLVSSLYLLDAARRGCHADSARRPDAGSGRRRCSARFRLGRHRTAGRTRRGAGCRSGAAGGR